MTNIGAYKNPDNVIYPEKISLLTSAATPSEII